jgi:hypothetical protein
VPEVPRLERPRLHNEAAVVDLKPWSRMCSFGPACPEESRKLKPRSPASAGCDAIANAATTAASITILHIASLPDRASGAARDVPGRARPKSELRGPLFDSFRVGWSVGHALVRLALSKAVEVEWQVIDGSQRVIVGRLGFSTSQLSGRTCRRSKLDGAADWLARRVDHASNSNAILLEAAIHDSSGLKRRICTSCRSA